jgi:hypothetical protein
MTKLSVIICTYNPKPHYFGRCLEALKAQTLPPFAWELVVVDNRSDEPLEARFNFGWHPDARLVREEKLGLTPARLRGIAEATGDLLVFVDDDNILDPDYLEVARNYADSHPWLGSWSGQCRGGFDETPPEWTRRYWGNLAIREFDEDVWSNLPRLPDTMPCGAGLCIRKVAAERYHELHETGQRKFQFDRTGDSLISGGDNDLAACACDIGLGVGLASALKLTHLMPPGRLTLDHLAKLAEGIHFSAVLLDAERGQVAAAPTLVSDLISELRMLRLRGPDRVIARAAERGKRRASALLHA